MCIWVFGPVGARVVAQRAACERALRVGGCAWGLSSGKVWILTLGWGLRSKWARSSSPSRCGCRMRSRRHGPRTCWKRTTFLQTMPLWTMPSWRQTFEDARTACGSHSPDPVFVRRSASARGLLTTAPFGSICWCRLSLICFVRRARATRSPRARGGSKSTLSQQSAAEFCSPRPRPKAVGVRHERRACC